MASEWRSYSRYYRSQNQRSFINARGALTGASCVISKSYNSISTSTCAATTRKNIVNGYTVEYATAGASFPVLLLA